MNPFKSDDTLGKIVVEFPKAAEILSANRIDYCCGGHRTFEEAILEQKLNGEPILTEINIAYDKFFKQVDSTLDYRTLSSVDLVDHILNLHHAFLWTNLPILSELSTKILRVHGQHHPELLKVHTLFHTLKMELEAHLIKEETLQYPAIKAYFDHPNPESLKQAKAVITDLESEHTNAGNVLKELRIVTSDFKVPEDGCQSYQRSYALLEAMEADVFQHIHLENNILFHQLNAL